MNKSTVLAVIFLLGCLAAAQPDVVVVRPTPIDDVLENPNTGITTFQRFNGQATNPPLKWSEVGPVTKLPQASTKPDFPGTTIAYLRWYWNALEPEPGKFHWDIVDLALLEARAHGQTLAIRLMPYSNQDPFQRGIRPPARAELTRTPTRTDRSGSLIFLIPYFSGIGANWSPRPANAMTAIPTSTASTFLPWATGAKAGALTCHPFSTRSN